MKEKKVRLCRRCKKPLPADAPWYAHVCQDCKVGPVGLSKTATKNSSLKKMLKSKKTAPQMSKGATGFGIRIIKINPKRISVR